MWALPEKKTIEFIHLQENRSQILISKSWSYVKLVIVTSKMEIDPQCTQMTNQPNVQRKHRISKNILLELWFVSATRLLNHNPSQKFGALKQLKSFVALVK